MAACARCGTAFSGPGKFCRNCSAQLKKPTPPGAGSPALQQAPKTPRAMPPTAAARPASARVPVADRTTEAPTPAGISQEMGESEAAPSDDEDPLIGQRPLGQYVILRKIGEGGFGAVYLADQP